MATKTSLDDDPSAPTPNYYAPEIIIAPFDEKHLNENWYDLHLSNKIKICFSMLPEGMKPFIEYEEGKTFGMSDWFESGHYSKMFRQYPEYYDIRNPCRLFDPSNPKTRETVEFEIPAAGAILNPAIEYSGMTLEYTEVYNRILPRANGTGGIGYNFKLHPCPDRATAVDPRRDPGDTGICGSWTMDLKITRPTLVKPNETVVGRILYEIYPASNQIR